MSVIKHVNLALVAVSLFVYSATSAAKAITSNEYQAVIDTAYNYFKGAANGDQALLNASFDMDFGDVKMLRTDKESKQEIVRTVPFQEFAKFFQSATKETWQANILSVDIVDDKMAMVKMDFKTKKTHYIDYLVMYKRNENWRIVNKTFIAKPREK